MKKKICKYLAVVLAVSTLAGCPWWYWGGPGHGHWHDHGGGWGHHGR